MEYKENEWIKSSEELPPCDGMYHCTNHPENTFDLGCCKYDGYGFMADLMYRRPKYWRYMAPLEKKYGKVG